MRRMVRVVHSQYAVAGPICKKEPIMPDGRSRIPVRRSERGFVLAIMALSAVAIIGCLGLAVDLGHMYIAKNEAQAYADAAALAGALKLDGSGAGVTNAKNAATGLNAGWNFMSNSFSGTVVEVATSASGPWTDAGSPPSPATNYTYLRVTASAPLSMYFMPVIGAFAGGSSLTSSTVKAVAVAAQLPQTTFNVGAFPFAPIAFDGATGGGNVSAPWGFVVGQQYTMRYAANGGSECAGDGADSNHIKIGSARGFWGDNSAAVVAGQVAGDLQEESLTTGQALPGVGGAKTTIAGDIVSRIDQDGDTTDDTYAAYLANPAHNGRRVITMPIQSEVDGTVLGFGTFFLLDDASYGHGGNSNWCAIYIGQANVADSSNPGAGGTPGPYQVKLVQ